MTFNRLRTLRTALIAGLLLVAILVSPFASAAPDDGYPQGEPAPGRTCPTTAAGAETVSTFNGKTFVCTIIDGEKKWWIKGEPLPTTVQTPSPQKNPEFNYIPKYKLSSKSLSLMKIYEDVTYATKSPAQHLDIYLPKSVSKPPLLIWTHGGGFVFGDENAMKYDDSAKLLEVLIKNGIAVASVNYRLAQEAMYPAAGIDEKSAIRFLRANASKYGYDPKKFATGGESAGSYLALMAAITGDQTSLFDDPTDPNIKVSATISTVIDLFGNADFIEMSLNKVSHPCDESKNPFPNTETKMHPWFGDTTDPKVIANMESANLYPFLTKSKVIPTFYIFHGSDDCSVSPFDSKNLDKAVKSLQGKSYLSIVPGAFHGGVEVWNSVVKAIPTIKKSMAISR